MIDVLSNSSIDDVTRSHIQQIEAHRQVLKLLDWDVRTGGPQKGQIQFTKMYGVISGQLLSLQTDEHFGRKLESYVQKDLNEIDRAQINLHLSVYKQNKNIPSEVFNLYTDRKTLAQGNWLKAKKNNDFSIVKGDLQALIESNKVLSHYKNANLSPFDQLLDEFEPGIQTKELDGVFSNLKKYLIPLLHDIQRAPTQLDTSFFEQNFPKEAQKKISEALLESIGFDFRRGRLGETEHPFSAGIHINDARLAVKYVDTDIRVALRMILHEGGHSLYNQHIHPVLSQTGLAVFSSMGLHESQAIYWEKIVGKHEGFWRNHYPLLQSYKPDIYEEISFQQFYKGLHAVKPSLVRYEADDITYSLHVIIRYELEKDLFAGNIDVSDLPEAWNEKYQSYLGISPKSDAEGVLQDGHWYGGGLGYFPSYVIGFIYAAQFQEVMKKQLPHFDQLIEQGKLSTILEWQQKNIHQYGKLRSSRHILQSLGIERIDEKPLIDFLSEKYRKLYNI